MRAVVIQRHGTIENLRLVGDYPRPTPGAGEVVVKVRATSLNYHDIFTLRGMPGIRIGLPVVPGLDIAGEVDEVGDGVVGWTRGQRVLANPLTARGDLMGEVCDGGLAQYALVEAGQLIELPDEVSFDAAAALPVAYGTAFDEPFASVDAQTRADLEDLLIKVRAETGATFLFVTHDVGEAVYLSDRVAVVSKSPSRIDRVFDIPLPPGRNQLSTGDFAEENPEVVASFQRALDKANAFANDNHDELRRIAVEEVKVDEDVAERLLFAHFEPGLDTEDIKLVASKAVEYGIISKEPNYDDIIVEPSS